MPLLQYLTLFLMFFSTHNILLMSQDIFVANCHNLSFVSFFYPNFFLFKNIKKILINTNDFCFNYQIKFFLKYRKKSYVENVWRKKNKKPKNVNFGNIFSPDHIFYCATKKIFYILYI